MKRSLGRSPLGKLLALAVALGLVLAACGGGDDESSSGDGSSGGTTVRFALDWTPNTNHTGLYVALAEGYFEDAGIDVEILPYNQTSPDTLVGSGEAELGISFQDSFSFSKAAGTPITSVMAVLQHWATEIAVRADRDDIQSPADLDGMTYAGFGAPSEEPVLSQVIQNDGGTGEFETVTLQTAAYEALYSGDVDFTVPFVAWEGIEAELRDEPIKTFAYTDYGMPDQYQVIVVGNDQWLAENPDEAEAFVQAMQQGYQFAAENPDEAAQILIDQNEGTFSEEELVFQSQTMLSEQYMTDANGDVGTQTLEQWSGYSGLLYEEGLLVDADGEALSEAPDYSTWFTNDYLAGS